MIVAVTGTGTGIGKTHLACALVGAMRDRGRRAVGWKPVESGVTGGEGEDERALREASGGSVAPTLRLAAPLAPNVAARREGAVIDAAGALATARRLAVLHEVVVVELAGGLCSPFDDRADNVDWLVALGDVRTLLVAPDRLGVLHDVGASLRAARQAGLAIDAVALVAPEVADASTGTNLDELRARGAASLHAVPRGSIAELRACDAIAALASLW